MSNKKLSVVLPCYNPDKNWAVNISIRYNEIAQLLSDYTIELILVNDGSSHNIEGAIAELKQRIPLVSLVSYPVNKGKGYAIRKGIEQAQSPYIVYTDVDLPYTNNSMVEIVKGLETYDVTVGTRGDSYYHNIPKHRAYISRLLRFFIRTSLRIPTNDTQGGLKGIRSTAKPFFMQTRINRYLFDLEFICIAARNKLSIGLIPVVLNENTVVRTMNVKVVSKEIVNFFRVFVRMQFR